MCPVCITSIVLGTVSAGGFTGLFAKSVKAELKSAKAPAPAKKKAPVKLAPR